jgi:transcriptional repressor NrdR
MHCPVCTSKETKVIDSRVGSDGMAVRRRRECIKCNYRFSTLEVGELLDIIVVKQNGAREGYDRRKLRSGIVHSLTKRPYTEDQLEKLTHKIERDIQKKKKREITSHDIGEIVMRHLKRFDKVAFIRFASIYRAFEDVDTFEAELRRLAKKKTSKK